MNTVDFNSVIREQIERCESTLCKKAESFGEVSWVRGVQTLTALVRKYNLHEKTIRNIVSGEMSRTRGEPMEEQACFFDD